MAQHDYVIANGTGAAVRSDLNNALAAIVSNNSGATEPTTTYAYMWWPDTTTGLLKIRNAANNAWVTVGSLASANLGIVGGKILQVVRSHVAGKASTTSTSLTKLATSASITPSSSSNKIKITISTAIGNADTGNANFSIVRNASGTDTTVFDTVINKQGASGAYQNDAFSWTDLDSPATTNPVTYSISGIRQDGNATPFVGGRNTDSSYAMGVMFILEEVAA